MTQNPDHTEEEVHLRLSAAIQAVIHTQNEYLKVTREHRHVSPAVLEATYHLLDALIQESSVALEYLSLPDANPQIVEKLGKVAIKDATELIEVLRKTLPPNQ